MHPLLTKSTAPRPEPEEGVRNLALHTFTYDDRKTILPALAEVMTHCGAWLLERKALSVTTLEYTFEIQQRVALELYSSLIGVGLELTRGSHIDLTSLCSVLRHNVAGVTRRRLLRIRLEVSFLEELDLQSILSPGAPLA